MRIIKLIGICTLALGLGWTAFAQDATQSLVIYLDADRTHHSASARAIEMGIKSAFSHVDNKVQGFDVVFKPLDHRGNAKRSKINMDRAFRDPQGLLVVAGLHSPPLIKYRDYYNENKMLTLVPWAAGGPITRYPSDQNWIFRLSIDDTKAGFRIVDYAIKTRSCEQPQMLLEQTPWGESNKKTMTLAMKKHGLNDAPVSWYNWGITTESARIILRNILGNGSDCVLFVGNAQSGARFAQAMISLDEDTRIPIYSHWGITGGNFHEQIPADIRTRMQLTFIQTCYSFLTSKPSDVSENALGAAMSLFPEIKSAKDIKAPPGFIHAYDMGLILIQAMSQVALTSDMGLNRQRLKDALEDLASPVQGLVKEYRKPFAVFSPEQDDAHEALRLEDFCMATYGPENEIFVHPPVKTDE